MKELLRLDEIGNQTVSARELHLRLEIETPFRLWFPRMCEYGLVEGRDYTPYKFVHPQNNQKITDYSLTLSAAKEISVIQRTQKGHEIRQYLIKEEEAWNTPDMGYFRVFPLSRSIASATAFASTCVKTSISSSFASESAIIWKYFRNMIMISALRLRKFFFADSDNSSYTFNGRRIWNAFTSSSAISSPASISVLVSTILVIFANNY